MSVTRRTWTDDSGAGTDGTILNNAELQRVYDDVDARWSRVTSTSTGTQTVINPTEADLLLFNNATDLTIRSITAPSSPSKPGKRLILASIGAGNVFLNHGDTTGTTAANRLVNLVTSAATPLAAGSGAAIYVYDDNATRWRLIGHDQGNLVSYSPTLTFGGGSTGRTYSTNTHTYIVRGRQVFVTGRFTMTAKGSSTGAVQIDGLPFTVTSSYYGSLVVPFWANLASIVGNPTGYASPTSTSIIMQISGAASSAGLTHANFTDTSDLIYNGHYVAL